MLPTRFQAIEPSVLLHLDVGRLGASAGQHAELALALIEELTSRLRHAYRALATNTFATVRSRVATDLLERAAATGGLRPGARVRVTQQALADATGSVREVVTRTLRDMRREAIVATDHSGVTILDVYALESESAWREIAG